MEVTNLVKRVSKKILFEGNPAAAALTTSLTGANNDMVYTADAAGTDGNDISVAYVDPALPSQAIAVTVDGTDIVVSLATGAGTNEVQTITVLGSGGTFIVGYKDQFTHPLAYDISAADLQIALRALPTINGANVSVTKLSNVYTVTFIGSLAATNVSALETNANRLKPYASPTVAHATTQAGDDDPATNEIQTVTIANANGGRFRIVHGGVKSAPIKYGARAATVQAALEAMSSIGTGNVEVEKAADVYTIEFVGSKAATAVAELTSENALRGVRSAVVATTTPGVAPAITSTAANVKTAVDASTPASALISVANAGGNDGTGVVTAMAATNLTGGKDGIGDTATPTALFEAIGGAVEVAIVANCTEDLVSGGSATVQAGSESDTDGLIPAVAYAGINAGTRLDISGLLAAGAAAEEDPFFSVADGEEIRMTVATADVTDGTLTFFAYYRPLETGARLRAL